MNKGWSLSSVYNFSEIRDVYLALRQWGKKRSDRKTFISYCQSINLPFVDTKWNERRLLEHQNALKNFSLVNSHYGIIKEVFIGVEIGSPLRKDDLDIFRQIYFSYFRFKEISSWFINPLPVDRLKFIRDLNEDDIVENSIPIFSFSDKSRFTDSFLYELEDGAPVYYIDQNNGGLIRFWDVFIKWGTTLAVLEKFSLRSLEIKTTNNKSITCTYLLNRHNIELNLLEYLKKTSSNRYIYLPSLVFDLATKFRLSIQKVQQLIVDQYKVHKEHLSFERTSEIFIKQGEIKTGEKILFPKYNDAYISHLIIRQGI